MKTTKSIKKQKPDLVGQLSIGIDVAKDSHWVTAMTDLGEITFDKRFANTPEAIDELIAHLRKLGGDRVIGSDMEGGMATLINIMLLDAGETVVHVPGRSVNRARTGFRGGDHKSDPKDARVIADQVRTRRAELRPVVINDESTANIRLLVRRRRTLRTDQTRHIAQLHEVLAEVHPGLEQRLDFKGRIAGFYLLTKFVTPQEIRDAGEDSIFQFLKTCPRRLTNVRKMAQAVMQSATAQRIKLPGEAVADNVIRVMATEAIETQEKLAAIDTALEEELTRHPYAALIQSLPGMGVILTAELIAHAGSMDRYRDADHLAAASGLAPVLRQTGRTSFTSRPLGGNKALKRIFYQSAFATLRWHIPSRIYYQRKRDEGKSHQQAVIALAKKRIVVLYAMLRDRKPYEVPQAPEPNAKAA